MSRTRERHPLFGARLVRRGRCCGGPAAVAIGGTSLSTGGSRPATGSPSPAGGATLRIGWTADPDNLSPFTGVETAAAEVLYLTYDRLFGFGLDGKPIRGSAAELPTTENGGISADGLTWTVHLRPGVTWQDGEPLAAGRRRLHLQR